MEARPVRTTEGKPTNERVLLGDSALAARMADALAATEPVERVTHGFHTYPAGLHPDAARDLLGLFPATSVLDPFCGGGTVLVEARVRGLATFGRDVSPTAIRVARARTATPDDATLTLFRSTARRIADEAKKSEVEPPEEMARVLREWYAPHALRELEALRLGILAADLAIRPLLEAVLSSILVKVSWRRSDTSAQRVRHHRPAETTAVLFHKKARELGRRLADLRDAVPEGTPPSDVRFGDARRARLAAPVDLALTSPPYPGTYDYVPLQHLRHVWFGERPGDDELGARRSWREGERAARRRWIEDTRAWTATVASNLAPGGHLVVVIGDGLTPAGSIDASAPTEEAAKAAGLKSIARASLERPDFARETFRWEHAFAFAK